MTNPPGLARLAFKGTTIWHPQCAKRRYLQHGKDLRPYPAAIFKRYYGLRGERMTHREIAEEFGVSIERIRQLRVEAEVVLRDGVRLSHNITRRQYVQWWHRKYDQRHRDRK